MQSDQDTFSNLSYAHDGRLEYMSESEDAGSSDCCSVSSEDAERVGGSSSNGNEESFWQFNDKAHDKLRWLHCAGVKALQSVSKAHAKFFAGAESRAGSVSGTQESSSPGARCVTLKEFKSSFGGHKDACTSAEGCSTTNVQL